MLKLFQKSSLRGEGSPDGIALESTLTGEQYRLFAAAFADAGADASVGWHRVMRTLAQQAGMK